MQLNMDLVFPSHIMHEMTSKSLGLNRLRWPVRSDPRGMCTQCVCVCTLHMLLVRPPANDLK